MSRVDEALRRAAEAARRKAAAETLTATGNTPLSVGMDPAEFAKESFPIEQPDEPSIAAALSEIPVEDAALPPEGLHVADSAQKVEAPRSVFERLDAKLAAKVVIDQTMMPASREQYRRLAAWLHRS